MKNELAGDIGLAAGKSQYDAQCKRILANKVILAWILKYTVKEFEEMRRELEGEEDTYGRFLLYLKKCASKMTYTIGEVKTEGDNATVTVSFTYTDASPIVTSVVGEYIVQGLALALSGADEAQMEELLVNIFKEKVEVIEPGTASADVTFNCVKVDGKWKISAFSDESSKAMTNIVTANIVKAFESFGTN